LSAAAGHDAARMTRLPRSERFEDALRAPLGAFALAIAAAMALGGLINLPMGYWVTGTTCLCAAMAALLAWSAARRGAYDWAASLCFYPLALAVTAFLWAGHGTRDYGLAAYPVVLLAGCVFLGTRAYWGLTTLVLVAATAIAVAEITGVRPQPLNKPAHWINLLNLWIILGGSAVSGRVLLHAVRSSLSRAQSLASALQTSEDRLQTMLRSSSAAIVVSRLSDGTYLEVNQAFLAMFGYTRDEVVGKTSLALGVWESLAERERFVSRLRSGQAVRDFETRQRTKHGGWVELSLTAEPFEMNGETCLAITATDIGAQRAAERRAEFLSTRDALTGLPNRLLALDRLQQALDRARAAGGTVAVLHVDLDRFQGINESAGRAQGDAVLREAAARLERLAGRDATLARIGGNEFLLIVALGAGAADALAAAVVTAFEQPFNVMERSLRVSASVGVSVFPTDSADAESLLQYADTAVREAKNEGRGRHCLYAGAMSARLKDRVLVESSLRESIGTPALTLAYQPKFDIGSGRITGVEALARWNHPTLGAVPPARFIAVAEESDLISELGLWVLRTACAQIAEWRMAGLPALPIAVNLSARQITSELPSQVFASGCERGVAPQMIELEVTETMLIARPEASRRILEEVSRNGNSIVLDDFGVGYSSMAYLKLLHLSGIKIDRSFVDGIAASRHDRAIVSAIVGLAHGLGLKVIAEGIENADQPGVLAELGCDEAQGFHLGRPMSGADIAATELAKGAGRR
jgi:diguanylate cyclase (GGDEF)-like protein/PAS domain S-box-containing protein